jgi:hypothetical protein
MGGSFSVGKWMPVTALASAALAVAACGDAKSSPKTAMGGSGGGTGSPSGKSGGGGASSVAGGDSGTSGSGEQGGSAALAGSAGQGGGGGSAPVAGGGFGEQVCSSDPQRCFDVLHQQWPGSGNAGVNGVAFDAQGNLVVSASTLGNLAAPESVDHSDFLLTFTPELQFVGALQQAGISRAFALDANDAAFRVGVVSDGIMSSTAGLDWAITRSAADGTETWRKVLASPQYDEASAMATDADGNGYVGGFTFGEHGDDTAAGKGDALLVKLAPGGDQLWARQFGSTEFDSVEGVCTDSAGNAYATGGVGGTFVSAGQGEEDLFVIKFSPSGEQLWAKQLGSSGVDSGTGIACGPDFIYVVGLTAGRLDDPQATAPAENDVVLVKYDLEGNPVWLEQWLTDDSERYPKVAVGLNGTAVVAGASSTDLDGVAANGPGGNNDLFVGEWSESGEPLWAYQWGSESWDTGMAVAVSPAGRIAVGAHTQEALPQFPGLGSGGGVLSVFTPR